jgi:hypothetical protein
MDFNFAKQQAKRIFKGKLILFIIIAIAWGVIFYAIGGPSRLTNVFGPGEEYSTAGDLDTLYSRGTKHVQTTADAFYFSGWYRTENNRTVARYYYYDAGDQFILVRMPASYTSDSYTNFNIDGTVRKPAGDETKIFDDFVSEVAKENNVSALTARSWVSPYVVAYGSGGNTGTSQFFFVVASAALLAVLLVLLFAIISVTNEKRSKSYKRLALAGNPDPDVVNYNLSREVQDYSTVTLKSSIFTRTYIVYLSTFGYKVRRGDELVWIYKRVTQNSYNGVPTGKTFQIICCFADGKTLSIPTGKKNSDEALTAAAALYPSAIFGFSQDLARLWKPKNLAPFFAARDEIIARRNAPVSDTTDIPE